MLPIRTVYRMDGWTDRRTDGRTDGRGVSTIPLDFLAMEFLLRFWRSAHVPRARSSACNKCDDKCIIESFITNTSLTFMYR